MILAYICYLVNVIAFKNDIESKNNEHKSLESGCFMHVFMPGY